MNNRGDEFSLNDRNVEFTIFVNFEELMKPCVESAFPSSSCMSISSHASVCLPQSVDLM